MVLCIDVGELYVYIYILCLNLKYFCTFFYDINY